MFCQISGSISRCLCYLMIALGSLSFARTVFSEDAAKIAASEISFDRDIKPILSDRCFLCHGPDATTREADLRLDVREGILRESETGEVKYVVAPGKPDESELIRRLITDDESLQMPPPDSNLEISPEEIAKIRTWVTQGAKYEVHWSFRPIPESTPVPAVKEKAWPRNPVDHFVLQRLENAGLTPVSPTTREKLIRRVTFDLTGLPPTLEEIDTFLADNRPDAYERLVDRLLASPRYGERMAANWMDIARYSDTYGYQVDRDRRVWPWRDWVIRAFNENLPYNEFVTQQIAGDLLENATDQTILATTFSRLHPQKVEGGSTPEEFRVEYVADRTQTFGTAFLGLTLECCRCHDHKYDPISQKEYYQLSAFFDNIDEAGLYSFFTSSTPTPTLRLLDESTKQRLANIEREIRQQEQHVARYTSPQFEDWLNSRPAPENLVPGQMLHLDFENFRSGANKQVEGRIGKGVKLTGDDAIGTKVGNFSRNAPFSVSLWINTPDHKDRAVIFHRSRAWTDAASRGYQLLIEDGRLSASLIHFWPGNAIRVNTVDPIPTNQWLHVTMTYNGSSRADGLKIYVNGAKASSEIVRNNLYKNITGGGGNTITIGERFRDRGFKNGLIDEFRVYGRELSTIEVAQLHDGKSLRELLAVNPARLKDDQRAALQTYHLATVDAAFQKELERLKALRKQRSGVEDRATEIMVMRELPQPRQTYNLLSGAYDKRGEPVDPETPTALSAFPANAPRNRLGLAQWLTDPVNPLTARVAANRLWQLMLGQGLVLTPEDFGNQGQQPTHPQLLDWLSREYMNSGWDTKKLLKTIVMSATYQQATTADHKSIAKDPENRLLSRAPGQRLSAEMLRDNALAVSGLLVDQIGGGPARPYEVEASFKPTKRDKGNGLYRRSLYTYWKRTGPAPAMMTLDASKRDVCRVKRERTSSPLQAFVMLNGPQFVEAARVLSQNLMLEHKNDQSVILTELFRQLTSRKPTSAERNVLNSLFARQQDYFAADPNRASQYLSVGDAVADKQLDPVLLATYSSIANTLLNHDECVHKR